LQLQAERNDELPKSLRELRCGLGSGLQSCWASRLCSFCSELPPRGRTLPLTRPSSAEPCASPQTTLISTLGVGCSRNRESLPVTDAGLVSHQVHGFHHDQEGRAGFPTDPSVVNEGRERERVRDQLVGRAGQQDDTLTAPGPGLVASSRNRESLPVTDAGLVSHQVHGFHHDQEGRAG
jgi:hypothetical protein